MFKPVLVDLSVFVTLILLSVSSRYEESQKRRGGQINKYIENKEIQIKK